MVKIPSIRPLRFIKSMVSPSWDQLKSDDILSARNDVYLKSNNIWYEDYPDHRQFTAKQDYFIHKINKETGEVYVVDDGGFFVPIKPSQQTDFESRRYGFIWRLLYRLVASRKKS